MTTFARFSFARCATSALGCGLMSCAVYAQPAWQVTNAGVYLEGNGRADDYTNQPIFAIDDETRNTFIAGFQGLSYGNRYGFDAKDANLVMGRETFALAGSKGRATIDGDGTQEVIIEWFIRAGTESDALDGFDAQSDATLEDQAGGGGNFFVVLDTTGVPAGTPLIIYYSWDATSRGFNRIEPPGLLFPALPAPPDYAEVSGTSMQINGVDQLSPNFDFDITPPFVNVEYKLENQTGQININAGQTIRIDVTGLVEAGIFNLGQGRTLGEDGAFALFKGRIRLSTGTPPIPIPPGPQGPQFGDPLVDFSVDIGGDHELSASPPDGDECFDPGDCYVWGGPALPLAPPPGADGYRNDKDAFVGFDPEPVPATFGPPVAPVCSGLPIGLVASQFFDLDGHDAMEFSLFQTLQNVRLPIAYFSSACINGADHLLISLEDDDARPYTDCDVPNMTPSPAGVQYGTLFDRDEVFGLTLSTFPPAAVINTYPLANEDDVHISLAPTPPPFTDPDDDDVDSLDSPSDPAVCGYLYFGADHEATYIDPATGTPLDPGVIYEVVPGGPPVPVIDPFVHLGVPLGVDLTDFEFAWLEDGTAPGGPVQLALLFAVHLDDPTTADDESGGLNPKRVYASFLTGTNFPLFAGVLADPIDGLASVQRDLSSLAPPPLCQGDANNDGFVNFADITSVLANFGNAYPAGTLNGPGDANHDQIVNFADVTAVLANFGITCP